MHECGLSDPRMRIEIEVTARRPLNARRYSERGNMPGMRIEIVVFDGFDEMDAVAPFEVF